MSNQIIDINGAGFTLQPGLQGAMRLDAKQLAERRQKLNAQHFDAMGTGAGFHLARDLEHVYNEVLREEFPPQSASEAFPLDTSVPAGAASHKVKRISQTGEAKVYRGNSTDIPRVAVSQEEESFPVHHYVIGIGLSIFDEQASGFANSNLRGELQTAAQVTVQEFLNHKTWFGDNENNIYGVLNYPWIPKRVISETFTETGDAKAMLAALNSAAAQAHEDSKTVYSPNAARMSPRLLRIMRTTYLSTDSKLTIEDAFLKANPKIKDIDEAWELQEAGPGGTDILLFYRLDRRSIANVVPKTFTMLPVQRQGFELTIPCYMTHGGVVQRDVLNNVVCYVNAE